MPRQVFPVPGAIPHTNGRTPSVPSLKDKAKRIAELHEEVLGLLGSALEKSHAVGILLKEVKEQVAHGTFEEWVEKNCPFKPRMARRYMQVADNIPDITEFIRSNRYSSTVLECATLGKALAQDAEPEPAEPPPPTPEEQAKALAYVNENAVESIVELVEAKKVSPLDALKLARLDDEDQRTAGTIISANGTVCANGEIEAVIREVTGLRETRPVLDSLGHEVPRSMREVFTDTRANDFLVELKGFFHAVKRQRELFFFLHNETFHKLMAQLEGMIDDAMPHSLCPHCDGRGHALKSQCRECGGRGWRSKRIYEDHLKEPDWSKEEA